MSKYNIDESRQIAIVWDISDVQLERPDLNDKEAMEVLLMAEDKHDANYGIGWETLRDHAHYLFPLMDVPVSEQDNNNCARCKFNASIRENKCRKYSPNVNAVGEEGGEAYCRNFEIGLANLKNEVRYTGLKVKYRIHGCIDHGDHIEGLVENDKAEFFGVYKVQADDTEEWIAGFKRYDEAQMFALEKEKEHLC